LGKFSDLINSMIETVLNGAEFTSANPDHINELIAINTTENPDFEVEIKKIIRETGQGRFVGSDSEDQTKKDKKELTEVTGKVKLFEKGNMGEINNFTSSQMGNVRQIATDPTGFLIQTFMKKFAKGIGVIALAVIIMEAVKWIISELLKPGRMLDVRFKRDISKEIIAFRRREEQQKLKQGFSNLIITSSSRLRGGQGQVTNTLDMVRNNNFPENIGMAPIQIVASGVSLSKGNGRRFQ
jgi:transcription antitermination factor NusA-like protein